MTFTATLVYTLKFFIPALCSMIFRAAGLGYKSRNKVILGFSVFTLYSFVVPSLLIMVLDYGAYTHIASIVMTVGSLSVLIFSTDTPSKTIFLHLVQGNMVAALSAPLNMIRHLLGLSYTTLLFMFLIASPIVCFFALRFWARPLRFVADSLHGKIGPIMALPIISQFIIMVLPTYPQRNFEYHPIFCTFMILVVELSFFLFIYNLYRNLLEISILAKKKLQQELLESELASYEDFLQTARQNRHDLHHHSSVLMEYLSEDRIDLAKKYLRQQEDDLIESALTYYCENATANAVFRLYERKTRSLGISYDVKTDFPAQLPLTDTEIGSMLSNLLENACEACSRSGLSDTAIRLTTSQYDYNLKLDIRNTISGKIDFDIKGLPISNKRGGGTGTRSIMSIVKPHGGMLRFSQEDNWFIVQILLPLQ